MSKMGNRNLAPKIISILFALVLWIYVMGNINPIEYENVTNIPVRLINTEELKEQRLAIKDNDEFKVKVRLIGRRNELNKILSSPEQIQIKADLRGYKAGINNIPLEVTVPNNIEVDVNPKFISIELEEIINSQKEVKVVTVGTPEKNFVVGNITHRPKTVIIAGPKSYVNSVENVVAKIDVTGVSKNFGLSLPLVPTNSAGEEVTGVNLETSYVEASLLIDTLKVVPIKPKLQTTLEEDHIITKAEVNPKEVILKGQKEILDGITEIRTKLINVNDTDKNKISNTELDLPEGVTLYKDTPITIDLHLEKAENATYEISKDKIIFNNIDEKLKIDESEIPENISVTIVALKNTLDSIKESDIKIAIDLNGLNASEYSIEPVVQLPFVIEKEIKSINLNPKTINIKLVNK